MNRMKIFEVPRIGRFSALVALAGLGLLFTAPGVKAGGCAPVPYPYKASTAPAIPFVNPHDDNSYQPATIVGLWHLIYTANYSTSGPLPFPVIPPGPPSSFQFLESFKTWHADGTEFENAILPPAGGNICFGVWKDLGHGCVKLHHIGLMFAADGSLAFIFTVDEKNTVAPNGKTYSGDFDFKLWPPSYSAVDTGTPLQEVKGTTAGTRISVD
jgi:hypothetical protein